MTEEERAEAEVQAKKREINQVRMETEDTMDRILGQIDYGNQQVENAYETLARQDEILYRTNEKIGEASVQARIAEANVKDLKDANKSMFNFYAMSRRRRDGLDDERLVAELQEKEERQRTYQEAQQAKARTNQRVQNAGQQGFSTTSARIDHSKYKFEDDDNEQEEREVRINEKTDRALHGLQQMHRTAVALGQGLDDSVAMTGRIAEKTSRVHDKVIHTDNHMSRFK